MTSSMLFTKKEIEYYMKVIQVRIASALPKIPQESIVVKKIEPVYHRYAGRVEYEVLVTFLLTNKDITWTTTPNDIRFGFNFTSELEQWGVVLCGEKHVLSIRDLKKIAGYANKYKSQIAELQAENAKLRAENAELRLIPGGPEHLAAKAHFENMQKA